MKAGYQVVRSQPGRKGVWRDDPGAFSVNYLLKTSDALPSTLLEEQFVNSH